ncbi:MAG: 4-hydroxythreonine-4-phosphate dehydrogenase PdxA [Gemmatimonadetes bacterium]|nr:4-hydroxythreonine-4-phosphate dehydrogenase PdxA [Gemmatimonadota bacterium]
MKPIAITMGDGNGVGPEIVLRSYAQGELPPASIVIGDAAVLRLCAEIVKAEVPIRSVADPRDAASGALNVVDLGLMTAGDVRIGQVDRLAGEAALRYVERATKLALAGDVSAVVTLPINKEATGLSAPGFSGHTEYVAALCGTEVYTMMLASERLIATHVSTHVSLREAIERVRRDRVLDIIRLTDAALRRLRPTRRIAVAGLNPHAGESGAFGDEEIREIAPAVELARAEGLDVQGPIAGDTIFMQVLKGRFDAVVCMYHDQGHIPMKLLDFEGGVNVTLGLPIVRTSVDHGTAFDIAYQGKAFTGSLAAACEMAARLAPSAEDQVRDPE